MTIQEQIDNAKKVLTIMKNNDLSIANINDALYLINHHVFGQCEEIKQLMENN